MEIPNTYYLKITNMKLTEKYNEDFTIEVETELTGMIVGNATVTNAVIFMINGILIGNINIEENSRAIIYGTVKGNITNFGVCEIYGTVNGELLGNTQQTFIDINAHVNKLAI